MPKYTAVLSKKAKKQLDKLTDDLAQPLIDAISGLEENPRPVGFKKLRGRDDNRIRTGDYLSYTIFLNTNLSLMLWPLDTEKIFMSNAASKMAQHLEVSLEWLMGHTDLELDKKMIQRIQEVSKMDIKTKSMSSPCSMPLFVKLNYKGFSINGKDI